MRDNPRRDVGAVLALLCLERSPSALPSLKNKIENKKIEVELDVFAKIKEVRFVELGPQLLSKAGPGPRDGQLWVKWVDAGEPRLACGRRASKQSTSGVKGRQIVRSVRSP